MKTTESLEVVKDHSISRTDTEVDIESLVRYGIEKNINPETMKAMMDTRRELKQEKAKAQFDKAFAAFQAECPVITKTVGVPDKSGRVAYKYAPFESIIAVVKPYLLKHGFSYSLDTDTESAAGWVIAKCHVTHERGHSVPSTAKFPLGTKTGIMSDTQVFASALTFASRRVFCNAFGLVVAGEDQNGITAKEKPQGPSSVQPDNQVVKDLAAELWKILRPVRGDLQNWDQSNQYCWDESIISDTEALPNLTPERFREVISKSKTKLIN
jgi:hypothetical protein